VSKQLLTLIIFHIISTITLICKEVNGMYATTGRAFVTCDLINWAIWTYSTNSSFQMWNVIFIICDGCQLSEIAFFSLSLRTDVFYTVSCNAII